MTFPLILLTAAFTAFLVSAFLNPLVARAAVRYGLVDRPGGIKAHRQPTPFGGGVSIILGVFTSVFVCYGLDVPDILRAVLVGTLVIFVGGLWDDIRPLGVKAKFGFQFFAAFLLLTQDVRLKIFLLPDWLDALLTVLWLVGIANAANLVDIMDGLAGGVCGIAGLTFGLIGILVGDWEPAVIGLSLSGALCGFLLFNFHPARMFMGDAGSQVVGFLLGAAALLGTYTTFNDIALFAPLLILGVPVYDTALVSIIRLRKGASPFQGSPDHLAIRLRKMGYSVPDTVRILILSTAFLSIAATAVTMVNVILAGAIYALVLLALILFGILVARVKVE